MGDTTEAVKGAIVGAIGVVFGTVSAAALVADVYAVVGVVSRAVGTVDMGPAETLRSWPVRVPLQRLAWVPR
jgi:hypothetical protein